MTHSDAKQLVSFLKSAFPKSYFSEDSMATYADLLTGLTSSGTAYKAIRDLVDSETDLPSFALIKETYMIKRQREIESRALPESDPASVPPPPEFLALLGQMQSRSQSFQPPQLVEAGAGKCDDCGHEFEHRYHFGTYLLCLPHAMARARVANDLDRGVHDMPTFYKEPKDEAAAQAQGAEGKTDALVEEEADART